MTSKESSITAAAQARETTEKVAGAWKEGLQKLVDQANMTSTMPPVDLNRSGMSSSQNGNGLTGTGRRLGKRTRV